MINKEELHKYQLNNFKLKSGDIIDLQLNYLAFNFPLITIYDNVQAQYTLLKEIFNIEKIKLVIGWSMGGQQAFEWASYFPDMVENMISMCGHAKTTEHTYVFLEGVYAALTSDPNWNSGNYEKQPQNGKTTMARVWAGWAHGQDWYREK